MKKLLLLSFLILFPLKSLAQNYLISFAGSGESSTVSTVNVENLTSGATLSLNGDDILQLTLPTEINQVEADKFSRLKIYPNPASEYSILEIFPPIADEATFSIYDVTGKLVAQFDKYLDKSLHGFQITGLKKGLYFINVNTNTYQLTNKLICNHPMKGSIKLEKIDISNKSIVEIPDKIDTKGSLSTIDMEYNTGEILKFTGISGSYSTVVTDIPSSDKTITFDFVSCTDGDNNNYPVVVIGTQTWMAENLKTTKYNDSEDILLVEEKEAWASLTTPGYCWHIEAGPSTVYGALYNWLTANSSKLCPTGWHVPSDSEWTVLINYLGGESVAGGKLKETGLTHWKESNSSATNESGFTAIAGSSRDYLGNFVTLSGYAGYWWSTFECGDDALYYRILHYYAAIEHYCSNKGWGFSVRCLKD